MKTFEEAYTVADPSSQERITQLLETYQELVEQASNYPPVTKMFDDQYSVAVERLRYPQGEMDTCPHCVMIDALRTAFISGLVCGIEMEKRGDGIS